MLGNKDGARESSVDGIVRRVVVIDPEHIRTVLKSRPELIAILADIVRSQTRSGDIDLLEDIGSRCDGVHNRVEQDQLVVLLQGHPDHSRVFFGESQSVEGRGVLTELEGTNFADDTVVVDGGLEEDAVGHLRDEDDFGVGDADDFMGLYGGRERVLNYIATGGAACGQRNDRDGSGDGLDEQQREEGRE